MRISSFHNYYKNPNFGSVKFKTDEKGVRTPENLKVQTEIGELDVVSEPQVHSEHIIYLDNHKVNYDEGKIVKGVGRESLQINLQHKFINGYKIETNANYQKKHKIGEILRLVSIMEMMENNLDSICLQSMPEAVIFHGKYKFVPDHDEFSVDEMLNSISKNDDPALKDCKEKAEILNKKIKGLGLWKEGGEYMRRTNELTQEYIDIIIENKIETKPSDFGEGFGMELTKQKVLENNDYFNGLFEKHGIDYKIE